MKFRLTFFLLLCMIVRAAAQLPYYDAVELSKFVDRSTTPRVFNTADLESIAAILKHYTDLPSTALSHDVLNAIKTDHPDNKNYNPILARYFQGLNIPTGAKSLNISSILSAAGGLNVTNFADGLAKFLVERSKEELNVAFFRHFQEFMQGYPELRALFPTTSDFLGNINSYQYAAMLPALRAGFQKDLNTYSSNLIKLRDIPESECGDNEACKTRIGKLTKFLNDEATGKTLVAAMIAADDVLKGYNAADVIEHLAQDRISSVNTSNFSNIIHFTELLSSSLRSRDEGRVWIERKEINALVTDPEATIVYIGLLYSKNNLKKGSEIRFYDGGNELKLRKVLLDISNNATSISNFTSQIKQFAHAAATVADLAKNIDLSIDNGEGKQILAYAEYAASIGSVLKEGTVFFKGIDRSILPEAYLKAISQKVDPFIKVLNPALDACYDIKSQNYSALVLHISKVLEGFYERSDYPFRDNFIKYATFMATIVEAQSSDEVKQAIEAIVLPVGSASIKRETDVNISLNAFIGPFAGFEYMAALKEDQTEFSMGVTAPVGIAFSWGNLRGKKTDVKKGEKSFSVFVQAIDIGTIASFRLGESDASVASEITLSNIVSPGLYFFYGLGKVPVSLGVGAQVGPELRQVTTSNVELEKNYYVRAGVSVVVDIPLMNFYTKSSK
jgi:hypothetical protein